MGTRIILISHVCIVQGNGQVRCDFLTIWHRFKRCLDVPIDLLTNDPIFIPMLPNLANAHLSKELKCQIENNVASSIQLKLKTQVDVNVETMLEKVLRSILNTFMSKCVGSKLSRGYYWSLVITENIGKMWLKMWVKGCQSQKGCHHPKGACCKYFKCHVHGGCVTRRIECGIR